MNYPSAGYIGWNTLSLAKSLFGRRILPETERSSLKPCTRLDLRSLKILFCRFRLKGTSLSRLARQRLAYKDGGEGGGRSRDITRLTEPERKAGTSTASPQQRYLGLGHDGRGHICETHAGGYSPEQGRGIMIGTEKTQDFLAVIHHAQWVGKRLQYPNGIGTVRSRGTAGSAWARVTSHAPSVRPALSATRSGAQRKDPSMPEPASELVFLLVPRLNQHRLGF